MKNTLLVALSFIAFINCYSQTPVPDFGVMTQDQIEYKECAFDKSADAVIFFDKATTNYDDDYYLLTDRRIRFKILKESGIQRANIVIPFYSGEKFEFLRNIEAIVLTPEGDGFNESRLDKKSIYVKEVNRYYSTISFALPNVKKGSIIEYAYTSVQKSYAGLQNWYFQTDIPILLSSYYLQVLPNVEFAYSVRKKSYLPVTIKPFPQTGSTLFEMSNIPGLRDEAFCPSEKDFLQRVDFQFSGNFSRTGYFQKSSTNWKEFNKDFLDEKMFAGQLNKKISNDFIKTAAIETASNSEKIKQIFDYVKTNVTWDEYYSKYSSDGIKDVWEKKKGNSAEVNFILINLLRSANIEAYPLLVSERHHGRVDTTYPFKDQFNTVVALVLSEGRVYVLDAKDHKTPYSMIPYSLLNTIGFAVDKKISGFVYLRTPAKSDKTIMLEGIIDPSGVNRIKVNEYYKEYARVDKTVEYKSSKDRYEASFKKANDFLKIDSFSVDGADTDNTPLQHQYTGSYAIEQSGDYYLLHYNLFTGLKKNPFTTDHRFTKIDFGYRSLNSFEGTFQLPDNLLIESLPKEVTEYSRDRSMFVSRKIEKKENKIFISVTLNLNKSEYNAEEYIVVKEFFSKAIDVLSEPVLLKAK